MDTDLKRAKQREADRRYRDRDPERAREKGRRWKAAHPDKVREATRLAKYRRYGLTEFSFHSLLSSQGYRCAICIEPFDGVTVPHIDHNHATGRVRGLLCNHCNTAIGKFRDSPERLMAAINYLKESA